MKLIEHTLYLMENPRPVYKKVVAPKRTDIVWEDDDILTEKALAMTGTELAEKLGVNYDTLYCHMKIRGVLIRRKRIGVIV